MTTPSAPRFKVSVKQDHIDTALPADSGHCMVADAVKDAFFKKYKRKAYVTAVDLQTIRFTDKERGLRFVYLTPNVAQRGLLQFDQGIKPTPFAFNLSNAQIVPASGKPKNPKLQKRSAKQKAAAKKLAELQKKKARKRAKDQKAASSKKKIKGIKNGGLPRKILGGKAPPQGVLHGKRRQFGVKGAGSLDGPTQD